MNRGHGDPIFCLHPKMPAVAPNPQLPGFARSFFLRLLAKWPRLGGWSRRNYQLVILKLDRIGDFILATGAIRFAINKTPGKTLLIVSETVEPVAVQLFPDAEVLGLPAFARSVFRDVIPVAHRSGRLLRSIRCETLLHLRYQPGDYHRLIQHWIDADRELAMEAIGYPAWRDGLVLPLRSDAGLRYPKPTETYGPPSENLVASAEIEAHRLLCESWLEEPVSLTQVWPRIGPICHEGGLPLAANSLLIAPFTSTLVREIRPDHLVESLLLFQESIAMPVVVACGPEEQERAEALVAYAGRCGVREIRLLPSQFLPEYIATVASARLVFSMDSATAHIACSAGTPGVALLGGGHYGCFAPWSKNGLFTWLYQTLPCYHCEWLCTRAENECLSTIEPKAVAAALLERFESIPAASPASQVRSHVAGTAQ